MEQKKDTQLPAEWLEEIKLNAKAFAAGMWPGGTNHDSRQREYVAAVHEVCATEYAIKLHQVEQENKVLNGDIEVRDYDIKEYNKEIKAARALLEKVMASESFPKLRDHQLANEIKTFLNGK